MINRWGDTDQRIVEGKFQALVSVTNTCNYVNQVKHDQQVERYRSEICWVKIPSLHWSASHDQQVSNTGQRCEKRNTYKDSLWTHWSSSWHWIKDSSKHWLNTLVTSAYKSFSSYLFNQNICCGYSKELSQWDGSFEHQNICYNWWVRKYLKFYAQKFCLS